MMQYRALLFPILTLLFLAFPAMYCAYAQQPEYIKTVFPKGTIIHSNIRYADDASDKHLLDLYLPSQATAPTALLVWIHGGAWREQDKYGDMNYMKNLLRTVLEKGYALASIDYRNSTTAKFPAQIQDCNRALTFLTNHAGEYALDTSKIVLIGFSAGGHLASVLGLSNNMKVPEFYFDQKKPTFTIKAIVDFYGPSNFIMFYNSGDPNAANDPVSVLLGASPLKRPDLATLASPVTYVDKNDPPVFIVHGENDTVVPLQQSIVLQSYLDLAHVKNEFTVVKGAPHFGEPFDNAELRTKLFAFLNACLSH